MTGQRYSATGLRCYGCGKCVGFKAKKKRDQRSHVLQNTGQKMSPGKCQRDQESGCKSYLCTGRTAAAPSEVNGSCGCSVNLKQTSGSSLVCRHFAVLCPPLILDTATFQRPVFGYPLSQNQAQGPYPLQRWKSAMDPTSLGHILYGSYIFSLKTIIYMH